MFYKGIEVETTAKLHELAREDAILVKCVNRDISAALYRLKEKYGFVRPIPNVYLVPNEMLEAEYGVDCGTNSYIVVKRSSLRSISLTSTLEEMTINADYAYQPVTV